MAAGFDQNAIPKGLMHMSGNYGPEDIAAFRRYWNQMVKGVNNAWTLPIMFSKDQESKASFEKFGVEFDEMMFSKWITFLTSVACAIYSIAPEEINFTGFSADKSSLSGSDSEEKITASKDKGLRPLLGFVEAELTDYFVGEYSDHLCFRFVGLDAQDPKQKWEEDKTAMTWGELRARRGDPKLEDSVLEGMPVNPAFLGPWQALSAGATAIVQAQQAQQQEAAAAQQQGPDYGQEGGGGDFGSGQGGPPSDGAPPPQGDDAAAAAENGGDMADAGATDLAAQALDDGKDAMGKALSSVFHSIGS